MSRTARLGAFILGTLAILAIGIFIIGGKKYLFTSTYELRTRFANVAGLQAGADVMVGGLHSGTIRSINLPDKPGEQMTVVMQLDQSTHRIIRQDSVASIDTEGLLGNQYVAVSFGSADKPDVNDGTVGALVNDKALYNNLDQTASGARSAVTSADAGIKDFQDNMEALKHNFLLRGYFKNRGYEDSADLGKDEIAAAPQAATAKDFTFQAKDLFDKQDSAKLKGQKALNAAGEYLAGNDFGVAVIEVSTGKTGSSAADLTLAQGRAMVVRDYIVQHYGFDDTKLKTFSVGKQADENSKADWGEIKVLVYPAGTPLPPDKSPEPPPANSQTTSK